VNIKLETLCREVVVAYFGVGGLFVEVLAHGLPDAKIRTAQLMFTFGTGYMEQQWL
jgi:hypothetical protein